MLAIRKTAQQLGIEQWEYDKLLQVRDLLESESFFKHSDYGDLPDGPCFNMGTSCVSENCGTVACIGGWMAVLSGMRDETKIADYVDRHSALATLFYPDISVFDYDNITPLQAVLAIDNMLMYGKPFWHTVVADTEVA